MQSVESEVTIQSYGGFSEDMEYYCLIDNIAIQAWANLAVKTFTCRIPILENRACRKVSFMDSFGRKFPFEDSELTEDTVCIVQAIDMVGDIAPSNKLPSDASHE